MTDHKTPLKFPNQVEQKNLILQPPPPPPPQYKRDKNVIDILLILGSVESVNSQKEYVVYNRGTFSDWVYQRVCSTTDAHCQ